MELTHGSGVTEYLGPVVAPHLEGDWTDTITYSPLSLVLYQGNSYAAMQYVPKGIDIKNNRYWQEVGNYNAQVEQYRQDVFSFDKRITTNTNDITKETADRATADKTLQDQLTELQTQFTELQTKFTELQTQFTELQQNLKSGTTFDQLKNNGFIYKSS